MRMLTSEARVDAHRFRGGFLGEQDYARLVEAFARLHDAKVFIDDTPSVGILEMRAKARRLKLEHGLDMLVIDYLQLMQGRGRFENRQQELASISRSLKILAKELERADPRAQPAEPRARDAAATIGRSSPTCASRARSSRTPTSCCSSSARTCTRSRASATPESEGTAEIIIGKQRNGPTGTVRLAFLKQYTRFENLALGWLPGTSGTRRRVIRPTVATRQSRRRSRHNLRAIRAMLARDERRRRPRPAPGIIAVVKANAYGHGAAAVGAARSKRRARRCSPARTSKKASSLRDAGVTASDSRVRRAERQRSRRRVHASPDADGLDARRAARALEDAAARRGVAARVSPQDRHRHEPARIPARQPAPDDAGRAGQPASCSSTRSTRTLRPPTSRSRRFLDEQRARFDRAMAALGAMGLRRRRGATPRTPRRSCATRARGTTAVRPGPAALRHRAAAACGRRSRRCDLPCHCTSRIVAVKGLRPGEGTGYGLRWRADEPRTIAIVPAGYADGLDTRLPGRGSVLVRGRRVPIVGSVCMDMIMVDVTGLDVVARRRSRADRPAGRRRDHRARNRRRDRGDSVGGHVSAGSED